MTLRLRGMLRFGGIVRLTFLRKNAWRIAAALFVVVLALLGWERLYRPPISSRVYRIGWEVVPPFQIPGADGQATGLAVDLIREAARRRGIRLQWVLQPTGPDAALLGKHVDLWPLVTLSAERRELFHITEPYLETELCMLVPAASRFRVLQDLAKATISLDNMPFNARWLHTALPKARLDVTPSKRDALGEVCAGRADAAFLEEYTAVDTLLSGGACANVALHWIPLQNKRSRLGVGAVFQASAVADAIRQEIGVLAAEGKLDSTLGQSGYMSGLHLESLDALLNADRRESRLKAGIALFAVVLAFTLAQTLRIRRERNRTRRAERAHRETEQKLRLMANNLTETVLAYDMNRKLIYANPAVETLTGYRVDELDRAGFIDWVHPSDRERMLGRWDGLFLGKSFREEEYRLVAKDGSIRWAAASWGPILDEKGLQVGVQGSERDITVRKSAEDALRESEARFRGLLENAQLAAMITDSRGIVTFCNQYVFAVLGWERHEVLGHHAAEFMVPDHRARVERLLEKWHTDLPPHWTAEPGVYTKSGKIRWFQSSNLVLRDTAGAPVGVATLAVDITEHRALQEQYLQAQKMEGLGRLAGGMAHDFNNLLTVINGYADIVFRKLNGTDPLRSHLDQVRKAGAQAADLTQQLLAFSRKQVTQPKSIDLNRAVAESEGMWRRLLGEDILVVTRLSPTLGHVMADAGQIHQVLMNLVVNARDAMPGGGTLTIDTSTLDGKECCAAASPEAAEGAWVLLSVSDTGTGMDDETRKRIFEPFFTTKPLGIGTGLGLSTVYGIVKQSRGWIQVESRPGAGSTFNIYLPKIEPAPVPDQAADPDPAAAAISETILLVEDQDDVRSLAADVLRECGYRVLATASATEALDLVRQHSGPIDLLLTDVVLPGIDGCELAEKLTALRPETRVLFTSGYAPEATALRRALDRGQAYLAKPYDPDAMAAKVRQVLDARTAAR